MDDVLFIHIPKTGGTSIERLFNIPRHGIGSDDPVSRGRAHFQHGRLDDIIRGGAVTPEFLESAYIFTFVRNPYDRAVSHYFFCKQRKKHGVTQSTSFKKYITGPMQSKRHHGPQYKFIGDHEIDFIGRFENFDEDVKHVAKEIGLGEVEVPHLNKSIRKPYRKIYTPETKKIIEDVCAVDFERFGYDREEW